MTTPLLPPPPPAAGPCSRHACQECQREYNDALWTARRKKYEGPETVFLGAIILLAALPLSLACLLGFALAPASPSFAEFFFKDELSFMFLTLGLGILGGAFLLYQGLRLWRRNPIDWDAPP